jgi:hypothetical protein
MFKNPSVEQHLSQNGFAVIDANLLNEIDDLQKCIAEHFQFTGADFYYSLLANTFEQNVVLQNSIKRILNSFYETQFTACRTITESFLVKSANTSDELLLHQDWNYTHEKNFSAYNIWIPLTDVTEENGTLFFLKGSHLWFNNLRSATLPTARISMNNFSAEQIETVIVKKGQALLFHPAAFHGSYPNHSSQNRIVVTATLLSKEAPFLYYQQSELLDEVKVFQLNDDTFLKDLKTIAVGGNPEAPEINRLKYSHQMITDAELKEKLLAQSL